MGASKRMMLAKAIKDARAAKAGASSTPAADPNDEDSDGVAPVKRRKSARVPLPPAASPQGEDSFRDNPPSATSLPPTTVQEDIGKGAESAPPPPSAEVSASPAPVATAPDFIAIPPPIMHLMRGFSGGTMPEGSDRKEGMLSTWGPSWRWPLNGAPRPGTLFCRLKPSKPWKQR